MKTYQVTLEIKGQMFLEVEADDEDGAISAATEACTIDHLESWEPTGNAEAECDEDEEGEEE